MTAKEQLRERTLRLLDLDTDPVVAAFRDAPPRPRGIAAGRTVSLDDAMREFERPTRPGALNSRAPPSATLDDSTHLSAGASSQHCRRSPKTRIVPARCAS